MTQAMSSSSSWRSCPPRFGTPRRPERKTSGDKVAVVARRLGLELMPWQQHVADVAFEVHPDTGRLAYREILLTVPRRSGKSALLFAVLMHRMIAFEGGQVAAFTMQNGLQARMRLRREWKPLLDKSKALKDIYDPSMFSGAEALLFKNGSRLEVVAGTSSSGHGATLDLAVVDEAFDQPDDRLEQALRPAIRTQPNAQLWWVSTAGAPSDVWFRGKVEAARENANADSGTAIFEWSAPEDADASDPAVWWDCMPALGFVRPNGSGLTERDIAEEYRAMTAGGEEDGFRRAYLNQWVSKGGSTAFDPHVWSSLTPGEHPPVRPEVFALDVAPDHSTATIAAAWRTDFGSWVQSAETSPGVDWVVPRWNELRSRYGGRLLVEKTGTAAFLVPRLDGAEEISRRFFADACSTLDAAVTSRTLRHGNQPELNAAVAVARWSASGEAGQRVLSRKNSQVSPLVAAALALHGLTTGTTSGGGWVLSL